MKTVKLRNGNSVTIEDELWEKIDPRLFDLNKCINELFDIRCELERLKPGFTNYEYHVKKDTLDSVEQMFIREIDKYEEIMIKNSK